MMKLWRLAAMAYSESLTKRPMLTEMSTSGCLWCLGDIASQHLETTSTQTQGITLDWRRTLSQTLYAALLWGPVAHKWYHLLDRLANRWITSQKPSRIIATKLVLEMIALHPLGLLAYFGIVGTLNGESFNSIRLQLQRDYWLTLFLDMLMWTPLDFINFAWVPVRHQLLLVNCACLIEAIALSYIKNNGIQWERTAVKITRVASKEEKEKAN